MGVRSEAFSAAEVSPSEMAHQFQAVVNYFNMIKTHEANRVLEGGRVGAPTTASTQASGAAATVWRVDIAALAVAVGGVAADVAASADEVIHDTTQLVANGQSCVAAIVIKNVAGTLSIDTVKGAAATTGSQVGPTDAAIQAAVGAGNAWVKIAACTINRTGDTTVTQSEDNSFRPVLGVNVDSNFASFTG